MLKEALGVHEFYLCKHVGCMGQLTGFLYDFTLWGLGGEEVVGHSANAPTANKAKGEFLKGGGGN